ncbi:MAG: hypothetical protein WC806_03340 [Candidatus Gracilibacteria bacterium]|jgi:hypothetical protein
MAQSDNSQNQDSKNNENKPKKFGNNFNSKKRGDFNKFKRGNFKNQSWKEKLKDEIKDEKKEIIGVERRGENKVEGQNRNRKSFSPKGNNFNRRGVDGKKSFGSRKDEKQEVKKVVEHFKPEVKKEVVEQVQIQKEIQVEPNVQQVVQELPQVQQEPSVVQLEPQVQQEPSVVPEIKLEPSASPEAKEEVKAEVKPINPFDEDSEDDNSFSQPENKEIVQPQVQSELQPKLESQPEFKQQSELQSEFESQSENPFIEESVEQKSTEKIETSADFLPPNSYEDSQKNNIDMEPEDLGDEDDLIIETKNVEEKKDDDFKNPFVSENAVKESTDAVEAVEVEARSSSHMAFGSQGIGGVNVSDEADVVDGFKNEFWDVMAQAGITKRKFFIIIFLFAAILVFGILALIYGIDFGANNSEKTDVKKIERETEVKDTQIKEVSKEEINVQKESIQSIASKEEPLSEIVSSYIFGLQKEGGAVAEDVYNQVFGLDESIYSSFEFGNIGGYDKQKFVEYVDLLIRMENIFNIDVYYYLDHSADRKVAIESLLLQMSTIINMGLRNYNEIDGKLVVLSSEYDFAFTKQNEMQTSFFNNLQNLYGRKAYKDLEEFLADQNASAEFKAQFTAYKAIKQMYINALNALQPRYDDIFANKDAIIKGVRVFDVQDSNIDAIIPLQSN